MFITSQQHGVLRKKYNPDDPELRRAQLRMLFIDKLFEITTLIIGLILEPFLVQSSWRFYLIGR